MSWHVMTAMKSTKINHMPLFAWYVKLKDNVSFLHEHLGQIEFARSAWCSIECLSHGRLFSWSTCLFRKWRLYLFIYFLTRYLWHFYRSVLHSYCITSSQNIKWPDLFHCTGLIMVTWLCHLTYTLPMVTWWCHLMPTRPMATSPDHQMTSTQATTTCPVCPTA